MSDETDPRVRYEQPDKRIARIVLARPERANAQDKRMLYELNDAFDRASQDDEVRVIILAADGKDFSSGHDIADVPVPMDGITPVSCWGGFEAKGHEGYFAKEEEYYLQLCWRWRNLPKPTIAEVQGRVIAGGLMLVWPCDLVVASDDASFADPVVSLGLNGHEFFTHLWELGARRAKEFLFAGTHITADEAKSIGMVNRVVPREQLTEATLELAHRIALRPSFGLKLAKLSINQGLEAQGQWTAIQSAFGLHHVGHTHNLLAHEELGHPYGPIAIRDIAREMKASVAAPATD